MTDKAQSPKARQVYGAVLELAKQGADLRGMRVQQIADAAGMGKGTLYEYFASKQEILEGTLLYGLQQELTRMEETLAAAGDFRALTEGVLDYIEDLIRCRFPVYELVMRVVDETSPCGAGAQAAFSAGLESLLVRAYASARAAGMAPDTPADYFSFCMVSAQAGFAAALRRADAAQIPALRHHTMELLRRGLGVQM